MSRPALPEVIHALKGTRATRAKDNGDVAPGRPKFPKGLNRAERQTFKRLVGDLEERRHCTKADREAIHLYCVLFTRWQKALADIRDRGELVTNIVKGKDGVEIPRRELNEYLAIAQATEKSMWAILQGLGLTPVSRSKVKAAKNPEAEAPVDPFEAIMNNRRGKFSLPTEETDAVN
ncbi:MAG TPA: phage terminase small subunit P27 family [Candidatus Acidoferrales bacterium]|nr:phage terminase small subunit P27 family [Candidatus Acidoferrales bacterium]